MSSLRFNYDPEACVLSVYIKKNDFSLAVNNEDYKDEYRVYYKDFQKHGLQTFVQDFSNFTKNIFNKIYPDDDLRDLIGISAKKDGTGYIWSSLLHLEHRETTQSFLNTLLNYAFHIFQKESKSKNKLNFFDLLTDQDRSKISLIVTLINSMEHAQPWKRKKKNKSSTTDRIKLLSKRINALEKQFGFTSEQMVKYYMDDAIKVEDIANWFQYIDELNALQNIETQKNTIGEILALWIKSGN